MKEVIVDTKTVFYCPYCGEEFEDEYWAEECRDICKKKIDDIND